MRIEHQLRLKYGLQNEPDENAIAAWAALTQAYVKQGDDAEVAGRRAACVYFDGVDTVIMLSEADTIEALLARALARE